MKTFLTIALMAFTTTSFAQDCVDSSGNDISGEPDAFYEIISNAGSCYQASQLAQACAWGSSLDVQTAGAAYDVCDDELKSLEPSDKLTSLLKQMGNACSEKYDNEDGTMYRSMSSYCYLSAIAWIVNLATQN